MLPLLIMWPTYPPNVSIKEQHSIHLNAIFGRLLRLCIFGDCSAQHIRTTRNHKGPIAHEMCSTTRVPCKTELDITSTYLAICVIKPASRHSVRTVCVGIHLRVESCPISTSSSRLREQQMFNTALLENYYKMLVNQRGVC